MTSANAGLREDEQPVSLVRALYGRFRQLIHEFAKFGVIGVIGLFITNGVYDVLYNHLGVGPVKSTTIATIIAAVVTYLGNRYWSFRHRERTGVLRETIVFLVLNGIGLLIQDAAVAVNYYILGLGTNKAAGFVALNFGIAVATLFRFWSYRRFVWLSPPAEGGGTAVRPSGYPPAAEPSGYADRVTPQPPVAHANGRGGGGAHRANGRPVRDTAQRAHSPRHG
jgi:putative flippase GtrA